MNKQVTVLVIEDDPSICELITLYAEKSGYRVNVANSGMKGLELFYDNPPDLVILDIMMPEMDGWEVCKEIRRFDKTPVIMLTGKGESYDKLKGFDLGTDDYLVKPFDPNELMARIKAVLRRANPLFDAKEAQAVVSIRDYGPGIRQENIESIWERFCKADKARTKQAGTGLGLSIVKHLLDLHQSPIYVKSEVGNGSIFTFTLPLAPNRSKISGTGHPEKE